MGIVLATYNIHRCIGTDGRLDIGRVVEVIRALDADVVALQEVDFPSGSSVGLLDMLARESRMTPIAGPTLLWEAGHYGNAILTRGEVAAVRRHDLAHGEREPRGALDVDILCNGITLQVVATHLGLRPFERRFQIRSLLNMFRSVPPGPTALLGDFNEWLPWGRPVRWMHRYFGRPPTPATFPSFLPLLALDRIWVHPLRALRHIEAVQTRAARTASDHLPVRALVEWK
jgi:endonuclease/exonuclease/phosphatase family metal-dependent hydrolase